MMQHAVIALSAIIMIMSVKMFHVALVYAPHATERLEYLVVYGYIGLAVASTVMAAVGIMAVI